MIKPVIRCSSLGRLFKCHGSQTLVHRVAPRSGNESFEGSFVHWEVAKTLIDFLGASVENFPTWPVGIPVTYKLPRQSRWLIDWFVVHAKESIPDDWSLQVENELRWEFPGFILTGHHDVLAISPEGRRSHGCDWKCVYNAVSAAELNDQVLGYLVLAFLLYGVGEASFDIVQPRVKPEEGEKISSVTLDHAGLRNATAYLEAKVMEALNDPMTTNSGPVQCAWCPAAMQCPSIDLEIETMKATLTPEYLEKLKDEPDDAKLGDLVVSAKVLSRPFEDAGEMIRERLARTGRVNAGSGVSITMEIRKGQYTVRDGQELPLYNTVHQLLPPAEVATAVKFRTDEVKQAIARVRGIPQKGKAPNTAEKVFIEHIAPMLEQGQARVLKYE